MAAALLALIVIAVLFGVGFAADILWFVAGAFLVLWVLGFITRSAERTWYRW
ncbi:MAG: hypothetical protein R3249_02405 [Nitriliruptorales bacterium]|nr:hypothetical protein [Nitriliruptorales bacterium]